MLDGILGFSQKYNAAISQVETEGQVNDLNTTVEFMHYRLNSLELACGGLWRLLKQHGYTEDQLIKAIEAADMEDGKRDLAVHHDPGVCPNCGKKILTKSRLACSWCGAPLPPASFD